MMRREVDDEKVAEVGDDIVIEGMFTDDATGDPINPSQVNVRIVGPDDYYLLWRFGTNVELDNPTLGTFRCIWVTPGSGRFYWRLWGSTSSVINRAHVGSIVVLEDPTDVTPPPV